MSDLGAIWAELALNTKPFKEGLSQSAQLTQQFGRKIAGDLRMAFFNALSPQRWMAGTVQAVAKAMSDINRITGEAQRAQIDFGAQDIPLSEMARMVALADELGVSIEKMVGLFKENSLAATELRATLSSLPTAQPSEDVSALFKGLEIFKTSMTEGAVDTAKSVLPYLSRLPGLGGTMANLFNGLVMEPGQQALQNENAIRKLLKDYEAVLKKRQEAEKKLLELQEQEKKERRTRLEGVVDRGRERSRLLMDTAKDIGFGAPQSGGLAGIGGFSAGAAISAATTGMQQVRLLSLIAENTRVLAEVARAESELTAME